MQLPIKKSDRDVHLLRDGSHNLSITRQRAHNKILTTRMGASVSAIHDAAALRSVEDERTANDALNSLNTIAQDKLILFKTYVESGTNSREIPIEKATILVFAYPRIVLILVLASIRLLLRTL